MVTVPTAAKKVISAAESMGFTVETREFAYRTPETHYATTTDSHKEGDIKTPAKEVPGLQVIGYRTEARLGFDATYAGGFKTARILDPVGTFRELAADYSYGPKAAGQYGYSVDHAAKLTARRNAEYNDGAQLRVYEWYAGNATDFYAWIDEWLKMLKSEHPPISAKPRTPRKTKEEKAVEREATILDGGDWSA